MGCNSSAQVKIPFDQSKLNIKLYWCMVSACNRSLKSLLEHVSINYEDRYVDMLKGEHKSEECLKLNPEGTIPFLVVNDKPLFESASLLRFIANAIPGLNYLYPEDVFSRHKIDAALDFNGTLLRPQVEKCHMIQWHNFGKQLSDEQLQQQDLQIQNLQSSLQFLENNLLGQNNKFITGSQISIADFQLVQEIVMCEMFMLNLVKYPNIRNWKESCFQVKGIKEVVDKYRIQYLKYLVDMFYKDEDTVWYFAIGSMINPNSLANRSLSPLVSVPGEALDHKIYFFGSSGFAEAIPAVGQSFHGVLHKMTAENMQVLDQIEQAYQRSSIKVKLYDGKIIDAWVYKRQDDCERNKKVDKPPTERYLDIMIRGASYYGVQKSYIEFLKNHENQPRKKSNEFSKLTVPSNLKKISYKDLQEQDKNLGENSFQFGVNGKVVQWIGKNPASGYQKMFGDGSRGKNLEMQVSTNLYEPLYGQPQKIEHFKRDHCAFVEDFLVTMMDPKSENFKVVALLDQKYID